MSSPKKRKAHAGRPSKVDELAHSLCCRWEGCSQTGDFASVDAARAHELQHVCDISAKGGDHTCRIAGCGKEFPNNSRLRKHLVLHSAKNFACTQCDKMFHEQLKLKRHEEVVHTGNKPFSCPDCPKQFSFKANLKTHLRTHSGERPFLCDFPHCPKSFAQASNRNAHMLTHKNAPGGAVGAASMAVAQSVTASLGNSVLDERTPRKKRGKFLAKLDGDEDDGDEDNGDDNGDDNGEDEQEQAAAGSLSLLADHAFSRTTTAGSSGGMMREFQSPILPINPPSLLSPPTVQHHHVGFRVSNTSSSGGGGGGGGTSGFIPITPSSFACTPRHDAFSSSSSAAAAAGSSSPSMLADTAGAAAAGSSASRGSLNSGLAGLRHSQQQQQQALRSSSHPLGSAQHLMTTGARMSIDCGVVLPINNSTLSFYSSSSSSSSGHAMGNSSGLYTPTMMSSFSTDSMSDRSMLMIPFSAVSGGSGGSGSGGRTTAFPESDMLRFLNSETPRLNTSDFKN